MIEFSGLPNLFSTPTKAPAPGRAGAGDGAAVASAGSNTKSPTSLEDDPLIANSLRFLSMQQNNYQLGDKNPLRDLDKAKPGTISRRTRSQHTLVDAGWDELDLLGSFNRLLPLRVPCAYPPHGVETWCARARGCVFTSGWMWIYVVMRYV